MALLQKQITHKTFGNGVIVEMTNNIISVMFADEIGKKLFLYPEAFEHFLIVDDPKLKTAVAHDLEIKLKKNEKEQFLQEKQEQEAAQRRAKELVEEREKSRKKTGVKKPGTCKKAVKKAALNS